MRYLDFVSFTRTKSRTVRRNQDASLHPRKNRRTENPNPNPKNRKNCLLIGSTRLPVLAVRVFQFRRRAMSTHKHTNGLVEKRFRGKSIKKIVKKQIDRKGKGTKLRLHETLWFGCARNATKTQL